MKIILQRVSSASVTINGTIVGQIGRGFLLLVGITHTDTFKQVQWLANKIIGLRVFPDTDGKMNRSLTDIDGELLVVSQFTLYGNTKKGFRPSFMEAAKPTIAEPLYEKMIEYFRENVSGKVATGEFGAMMDIQLVNDGPVTIILEREAEQ